MSRTLNAAIAVIGIDIRKNSFHIVAHGERGARFANLPPCLIGMEACVGAHHLSRKLNSDETSCLPRSSASSSRGTIRV